jgi:hypothetical protein
MMMRMVVMMMMMEDGLLPPPRASWAVWKTAPRVVDTPELPAGSAAQASKLGQTDALHCLFQIIIYMYVYIYTWYYHN